MQTLINTKTGNEVVKTTSTNVIAAPVAPAAKPAVKRMSSTKITALKNEIASQMIDRAEYHFYLSDCYEGLNEAAADQHFVTAGKLNDKATKITRMTNREFTAYLNQQNAVKAAREAAPVVTVKVSKPNFLRNILKSLIA